MPESMTPRQRVRLTLQHQEPDRVPISLGGSANHLTEQLFIKLVEHFEVEEVPRRTLVGFYTTPDYNPVLDKLGTDFRFIHIRPPENYVANSMVGDFSEFVDEWGLRHRLVSACTSKIIEPSHVLLAMGLPLAQIEGTIRFSFGYPTTIEELEPVLDLLPDVWERSLNQ